MQRPPGAEPSTQGLRRPTPVNPQLLLARDLVVQTAQDIQTQLPEARRRGFATVSGNRLQRWQRDLQIAVNQLERIPTIQIFPPPPITRFIQGAIREINQAREILGRIPVTPPRRFPPQPGIARIPLRTLQEVLGHLFRAIGFINQALRL